MSFLVDETARKLAEFLLQIKAIQLQPAKPFTWSSGMKAPIYTDNRLSLSFQRVRTFIRQEMVKTIERYFGRPDVIAGVATGAIAQGALVAEALGLPFVYVRPTAKEHGTGKQVEGIIQAGQSVVVIEDLVSTGQSSLNAISALRDLGAEVKGMVAIFNYGFPEVVDRFKAQRCAFYALSNFDTLLNEAVKTGYISETDKESLLLWHENPSAWSPKQITPKS